jgi:hypothetical protein
MASRTAGDYLVVRPFDRAKFVAAYQSEFQGQPKYSAASTSDLLVVLGMLEKDPKMTDLRWMAYLLATTFLESSTTLKVQKQVKDKHGRVTTRTVKKWKNFTPVIEKGLGRGKRYGAPVKVALLRDGSARVTEQDGDQWTISRGGAPRAIGKGGKLGVTTTRIDPKYAADDGEERAFYGRGFVQLTWWANYAAAGVMVGRGLDLLTDPDLVDEPKIAYEIISIGMRTGGSFANRHKFADYFNATHTDYVSARAMVNGSSGQHEVAGFAERFERVLFQAKPASVTGS